MLDDLKVVFQIVAVMLNCFVVPVFFWCLNQPVLMLAVTLALPAYYAAKEMLRRRKAEIPAPEFTMFSEESYEEYETMLRKQQHLEFP